MSDNQNKKYKDKHKRREKKNLPQNVDVQGLTQLNSEDILNKIQNIKNTEELKEVAMLFNLNIAKKEMSRALQQDELLDIIIKQARERLSKRPDEHSTKDLLDYYTAFQSNLDKTKNYIDRVEESPAIQINDNKKITVNVQTIGLGRDANEDVIDAVQNIVGGMKDTQSLADFVKHLEDTNNIEVNREENKETDENDK